MAWQLIYTSAPRSLEAGRSGFGTVARHRAINPLLASAVERLSQFSRLPGYDTGRVIYCYRSLPIAGATYHILSSVRDAGADYTGRTNHIAHHLVAEAREVAHLGASGPSPADILLGMAWATAWTELPRYLEADEEIPLAGFHPLVHGSEWKHVTGRATQAWLLAMPEAIRGAYVISSPVMDLRQIFGESLRLVPDRLWKIPFTTSFQPSDEPADLRWIGVESTSPMRAQTEAPGRPVFDLSVPESLQLVEVEEPEPAPAPPVGVPAGAAYPAIAGLPVPSAFANPGAPAPAPTPRVAAPEFTTRPARVRPAPGNSGSSYVPPRSGSHNRWILVGAGIVLAVLAIVAVVFIKPMIERKQAIEAVAARFGQADPQYGGGVDAIPVATTLVDRFEKPTRDPLIDAAVRLNQTLKAGRLTELNSKQTTDDLAEITGNDTGQLPPELHRLRTDVQAIRGLLAAPAGFQSEIDVDRLKELADEQAEQFRKLFPASSSIPWQGSLLEEFQRTVDRRLAQSLLRLVTETSGQPLEGADFQTKIKKIESGMHDSEALATMAQVNQAVEDLRKAKMVKAQGAPAPSPGDKHPDGASGVGQTPGAPPARTVEGVKAPESEAKPADIYVVSDSAFLSVDVPQGKTVTYYLKQNGSETELKPFANDINLGLGGEYFKADGGRLRSGKSPPPPPYELSVRGSDKVEIAHVYVGFASAGSPLLPKNALALERKGDTLAIKGQMPRCLGDGETVIVLEVPPSFDGGAKPKPITVSLNGTCALSPVLAPLRQQVASLRAKADASTKEANREAGDAKSVEALRAKAMEYAASFQKADSKKVFDGQEKNGPEIVGDFAKALADEWGSGSDHAFDQLRSAGSILGEPAKKPHEVIKRIDAVLGEVQKLEEKYRTRDKEAGMRNLRDLCEKLKSLLGDSVSLDQHLASFRTAAEAAETEAKRLESLPVLNKEFLPPGDYRLLATWSRGAQVTLYVFNVK